MSNSDSEYLWQVWIKFSLVRIRLSIFYFEIQRQLDRAKYCKHTYKSAFGSIKRYLSSFDTIVDIEAHI